MEVREIPVGLILADHNIRVADEDLAPSLDQNKQIEPIQVYMFKDYYRILHGHRRYAAAVKLGWKTIGAIIVWPPENPAEEIIQQLVGNRDRKDLTYSEVARVYKTLRDEYGWKQRQIAQRFDVSDAEVSLAISLLDADEAIQRAVEEGRISPSAVEPLLALPKDQQKELAPAAIKSRTTRRVKSLVKTYEQQKAAANVEASQDSVIPDDVDPLEALVLTELEEVRQHIVSIKLTPVQDEGVIMRARAAIKVLIGEMRGLYQNFGMVGNDN